MNLDEFTGHQAKEDKRAQRFVNDCRNRIKSIESTMGSDWETPEYIRAMGQLKFLNECIEIIIVQQQMSVRMTEAIGKELIWSIDKETELLKEKLLNQSLIEKLDSARSANKVLAKLMTKLDGRKIIKRPIYILNQGKLKMGGV